MIPASLTFVAIRTSKFEDELREKAESRIMLRIYRFNWDFSSTAEAATGILLLTAIGLFFIA